MDSAKIKIRKYTEAYKTIEPFKSEYQAFLKSVNANQARNTADNKHAAIKNGTGVTERLLTEIPETLYTMLFRSLAPEEWVWFDSLNGKKWLAQEYKEFSATGGRL